MARHGVVALLALFLLAAGTRAGEISGRFQSINLDQATVTIRVDGKDLTYRVTKDARFYDDAGRELRGGLRAAKDVFKGGQGVSFSTTSMANHEWVTEVKAKR
jgi:hypothetical protein